MQTEIVGTFAGLAFEKLAADALVHIEQINRQVFDQLFVEVVVLEVEENQVPSFRQRDQILVDGLNYF